MATQAHPEDDPRLHTQHVRTKLAALMDHLREDIGKVDDPKAQALFETTAEVLGGLLRAFEHYEQGRPAWRRSA